jgi:integrase
VVKTCGKLGNSMPKKSFRPQHLELRYKTYFALLTIPKDVQHIIGKTRFFKTTGTGDLKIAQAKADLFVIKWKAEIAKARQNTDDPIINSALELNKMSKSTPWHMLQDVIDEETDRLQRETGEFVADAFNAIATGKAKVLDTFIPAWEQHQVDRGLVAKNISQMKSDLSLLTEYIPTTEMVTNENCDAWINLIAQTNNYKSSSVTRVIAACNNFYRYLQDVSVFPSDAPSPFKVPKTYKQSKKANAKVINKRNSWEPFTKTEVEGLHALAQSKGDSQLADLIEIAAYTGARIEEICSLKTDFINLDEMFFQITDAKTTAGNRLVPLHSKLTKIISRLIDESKNSYIFSELTENKYGDRSNAIGKRFGHLKKNIGHSRQHVFHSIRKTFTTELERAGVAENVAADIVGHEKHTMTYGLYSGGSSIEQKRNAIESINYNFKKSNLLDQPTLPSETTKKTTKTAIKKSAKTTMKSVEPRRKKV